MSNHAFVVLVGFDETPESEDGLRAAFDQASKHPLSHVHVVRVLTELPNLMTPGVELGNVSWTALVDRATHAAHLSLRKRVAMLFEEWVKDRSTVIDSIEVHTPVASPAEGILDLAEELNADLVVVGQHHHGRLHRMLFGSVAERVTRKSDRPVLVVHHRDDPAALIEPPCPECVQLRFETQGAEQWCQRHREHHTFGHALHYRGRDMQPEVRSL